MQLNIKIPSTWNQLTGKQTQNICYTLHCNQLAVSNTTNQAEITRINTYTFYNISRELLSRNNWFKVQKAMQDIRVKAFTEYTKFIYGKVNLHRFPKYIKTGLFKTKKLYGPNFRLNNITIAEFSYADAVYYKFKTTNNQQYLNLLCATLYRQATQPNNLTDVRTPFTKVTVSNNSNQFKKVSLKQKLAIAYAFEGSRNYITTLYPNVFPVAKTNTKQSKPQQYTPFGKLISAKIEYDPSKLEMANKVNAFSFFGIYENELKQLKLTK